MREATSKRFTWKDLGGEREHANAARVVVAPKPLTCQVNWSPGVVRTVPQNPSNLLPTPRRHPAWSLAFVVFSVACTREPSPSREAAPPRPTHATKLVDAASGDGASRVELPAADAAVDVAAPWAPPIATSIDGPYQDLSLGMGRPIYYAMPKGSERGPPFRLVGHLHGMCGPPPYACGKWIGAGTDLGGVMVCPTGNARCGDSPIGPPSWEAPSWPELVSIMDHDLEAAIAKVDAKKHGIIERGGAILTGYSRGAYAAPIIARTHPGRWPHLILIEANAPLNAASLRAAHVRSVALVAGEQGDQIAGMKKTEAALVADHFPTQLFTMKKTGHLYAEDMEYVMHDAIAYVLTHADD